MGAQDGVLDSEDQEFGGNSLYNRIHWAPCIKDELLCDSSDTMSSQEATSQWNPDK